MILHINRITKNQNQTYFFTPKEKEYDLTLLSTTFFRQRDLKTEDSGMKRIASFGYERTEITEPEHAYHFQPDLQYISKNGSKQFSAMPAFPLDYNRNNLNHKPADIAIIVFSNGCEAA